MKKLNNQLTEILKKVFNKKKINKDINNLKMGDLKEWDSIANFNLILEVEKKFRIKFSTHEFSKINSIKDLKILIKKFEKN
jgi:acyl carrier protein